MSPSVEKRTWWGGRRHADVEDRALPRATTPPSLQLLGAPGAPAFTAESALRIGDVWACVRVLVDAAASVPLIAYRATQDGRVRAGGQIADLLHQPAPATTQAALIGQLMTHLVMTGNAYLGKFRDTAGRVEALGLLHPDLVVIELKAGQPVYTVTGPLGQQSTHGPEDILHVRAPLSLDGLTGMSPIRQCRVALGLADGLAEHALAFFRNGARPSGIVSIPDAYLGVGERRDELMAQLRTDLTDIYAGGKNAHRIALLSGEITWTALAGSMEDMLFVEQRHLSTADIARIFRVPPWMVGASSGDSMTYSNTESQALSFVTHSLRPWLVVIEQAISADADLCPGGLYAEFLLDALLRADSATRATVYAAALNPQTGWMTRAEVRRLENLPAEPDPPAPTPPTPGAAIA